MRVALVDPASFTPAYDHELATSLASRGLDVVVATSRFRFGEVRKADGYERAEIFYPASSRLFRRSRLRLPLRAAEHPLGLARLGKIETDIIHVQWAPLPELDVHLLPLDEASVITAHDILPRRTAKKRRLWRRLYRRFDRVVVHSEHGRTRLIRDVGVDPRTIAVIPHPAFGGPAHYEDDGRTILFVGTIRPYKQLDHAIGAARAVGARLLVVGDPMIDVSAWDGVPGIEWRLGYVSEAEIESALSEATLAVFPYREELDQSGALLRCLGAGVPAVAYDVGGIAEPVRAFRAGAVVEPDDRTGLAEAIETLFNRELIEQARAGARRAAAELTWERSADAHAVLYEEIRG